MHSGLCCGLYRGTFYLKDLSDENAALLPVGNAEATITQEMTEITQPNFQSLGGNNCKVTYPESVNLELVLHCTNPENLAIAFLGDYGQYTEDAVVDELHPVNDYLELIPFEHVPSQAYPIVVTAGASTFVEGTDYVVTNAGIQILEGSTIPVDGTDIEVSYSYGANWYVDMQTVAQKDYLVVLDGFNVGEGAETPVVAKFWKVKFAPTESFAIISGTEFASLNLQGEIIRDETKATGSKFGRFEWGTAQPAGY